MPSKVKLPKNQGVIMVDSFLNGIIIFKRGKQDSKLGQPDFSELAINRSAYIPVKESKNCISINY